LRRNITDLEKRHLELEKRHLELEKKYVFSMEMYKLMMNVMNPLLFPLFFFLLIEPLILTFLFPAADR